MVWATRLAASSDLVGDGALAGVTFALADYGRLAVTCHCGGIPWRLRWDATRGGRIFPEFRGFSREMATHVLEADSVFPAPPWSRALPPTRRSSTTSGRSTANG